MLTQGDSDWPDTHFIITTRSGGSPEQNLVRLCKSMPGFTKILELQPFDTNADPEETKRLIAYLRENVPACRTVDKSEDYLESTQGYFGVIDSWTSRINREQMANLDDLRKVATQAQRGRYPEFDDKIAMLDDESRKLCIRITLLPDIAQRTWPSLKPILMNNIEPSGLDRLFQEKLLEDLNPPCFGHQSRIDYLQSFFCKYHQSETHEQCTVIVRGMADQVRDFGPRYIPYIAGLASLAHKAQQLKLDIIDQGMCEAALSILGAPFNSNVVLQASAKLRDYSQSDAALLVAAGLANGIYIAKNKNNLSQRSALLQELCELQKSHADNKPLRKLLAIGLFNIRNDTKSENNQILHDEMLEKLKMLQQIDPKDAEVRKILAEALLNAVTDATSRDDLSYEDYLCEMRELLNHNSEDANIRRELSKGLFNVLILVKEKDYPRTHIKLLDELRELHTVNTSDTTMSVVFGKALHFVRMLARKKGDIETYNTLDSEFSKLLCQHSIVHEIFF